MNSMIIYRGYKIKMSNNPHSPLPFIIWKGDDCIAAVRTESEAYQFIDNLKAEAAKNDAGSRSGK